MNKHTDNSIRDGEHMPEWLSPYLDGALGEAEQNRVHAHIESCEECKAAYTELLATQQLLRNLPPVALPRAFTLSPEITKPRASLLSRLLQPRWSPLLATGSVLSFALLALALLGSLLNTQAPNQAPATAYAPASRSMSANTPQPVQSEANGSTSSAGQDQPTSLSQPLAISDTQPLMAQSAVPSPAAGAQAPITSASASGLSGPTTTMLQQAPKANAQPVPQEQSSTVVLGVEAVLAALAVVLALAAIIARRK